MPKVDEVYKPIVQAFQKMGAVANVQEGSSFSIGVDGGEFNLVVPKGVTIAAADIQKKRRHLLLHVGGQSNGSHVDARPRHFLCGHDETQWFSTTITNPRATTVDKAMESLVPEALRGLNIPRKDLGKHKGRGWRRQGEWFFVPAKGVSPDSAMVMKNERLQRDAASKPHICEFMYRPRENGTRVFVARGQEFRSMSDAKAQGIDPSEVQSRIAATLVYVKGRVSHPDHKTITLTTWHTVYLNREAFMMGGNRFLD